MRRSLLLALAVAVLALLVTAVAAQGSPASRPFKGSVSGTVSFIPDDSCPPPPGLEYGLRSHSEATGTVSHMGRVTMTSDHCSGFTFAGSMTLVAANGDEVFVDYWSVGPPALPGEIGEVYEVPAAFEVTGGTGRFANATGGGELPAEILFPGFGVPVWQASWGLHGTIGY